MLFGFNGRVTRNFLILLVSMHYILFIDRVNLAAAAPVMDTPTAPVHAGKTYTLDRIDLSLIPQALREKVEQAMPVRAGDTLGTERLPEIERAVQGVDSHLRVHGTIQGDKMALHVALAGLSHLGSGTKLVPTPHRINVGGNRQALNLVSKVIPVYPAEAKQARIQGMVSLQALIGKDGHVVELEMISGHPLLVPPSVEAVKQWVYKPTLLNGNPVEVITQIDVNYTLAP